MNSLSKQLLSITLPKKPSVSYSFLKNPFLFALVGFFLVTKSNAIPFPKLFEGNWRGVFRENGKEVPFNFSISYTGLTPTLIYQNADERFKADLTMQSGDTLVFPVDVYDAKLIAIPSEDKLIGYWSRNSDMKRKLEFEAHPNREYRFWSTDQVKANAFNVEDRWEVSLVDSDSSMTPALAEFREENDRIFGTILTTTGDYRFLEGQISADQLKLSSFSGGSVYLLDLKFVSPDSIVGTFGGIYNSRKFFAKRNSEAALPDAYSLTYLKEGYETLDFAFPDLNGNLVSLTDTKYQGKVKIVTIMGTWCPNCMDESNFLGPWYQENKDRGIEVIALSFEQKDDLEYAKSRFEKFSKRFGVGYDVLFAGKADKKSASEKLPALSEVLSFPTTIFIDKKGKVRKIHTGFMGPATGVHYERFKEELNALVDLLIAES